MATYDDRVGDAYRKHVADGIRTKFADQFDFSGLSDQDVINKHYARFGAGMDPETYQTKIDQTYGPGFQKPSPTLPERASQLGEGAKEFAKGIVPFVVPEAPKAAAAVMPSLAGAAKVVAKSIPVASQLAFAGGHMINQVVDTQTAAQLDKAAESLPVPNVDATSQKYYAQLHDGLAARGYSDEQIMDEARARAKNIARGYQQTTDSIDKQTAEVQQQAAVSEPAHAAADAFFLGIGAPAIEGLLSKGLTKIGLTGAAEAAAKPATTLIGNVATHIKTGAVIGAPGMGIQGAVAAGVQAAADNKSPQEIGRALVGHLGNGPGFLDKLAGGTGAIGGLGQGALGGALIGTGAGALEAGIGAAVRPIAARQAAAQAARDFAESAAQKAVDDARLTKFQDQQKYEGAVAAKTAADKRAAIARTASTFDPHYTELPQGDPAMLASAIIAQKHGPDAAMSEEGLRAATQIEERIRLYQDANSDLANFQQRPLPTEGAPAPQPEITNSALPPTESAPTQTGPPLGPVETGGVEPVPAEPNPKLGAESPRPPEVSGSNTDVRKEAPLPAPSPTEKPAEPVVPAQKPRETNPAAQHVVETYKQENKFVDRPDRDMYPKIDPARATQIAEEYHGLQNAEPGTPEFTTAKKSYDALNKEIAQQYKAIKAAGFKIKFVDEDPYKNSEEMRADVRDNKTLKVLKTPPGHHPFMTSEQNDIFRAVHDFFGHAAEGYEFGPRGEEAAFQQHAATLSNDAIPALASETRGQNSWVNFMPENAKLPAKERPFAEQKFNLMPQHTYEDVLHPTPPTKAAGMMVSKIGKLAHADIEVTPHGTVNITRLGKVSKPGGTPQDLDTIVRAADEHGVKVETDLVPPPGPTGGRIPLEKVIPWYEARGFRVVDSTRIPEGNLATAKLVRDPIGEHQAKVASALESVAAAARKRIADRGTRLQMGVDPTDIADRALVLAADMFSRRLRTRDEIATWAVQKWGDEIKPVLDKVIDKAQQHFVKMFKVQGSAEENLNTLLGLAESGRYGMGWYEKTADWAKQKFGDDSDMMLRFLAVTSANGQTESGAAMALKAFAQWKAGMPFEGFRGQSMTNQLEKVSRDEDLGKDTKIQNFLDALRGNPDAVVLDRWMMDALNLKDLGGSLPPAKYKMYVQVVKDLARENGMTPRQFQAAVWEGARVRKAHISEATGGRALTTKSGSARPLEELVDRKLGGLSPEEYVQQTHGNLKMMENLYRGLKPVRTGITKDAEGQWHQVEGAPSGHTFDPDTFEPAAHKGYVVSLVSNTPKRESLYPARLLKFKDQVKPLIDELKTQGLKPTLGVWQMSTGDKPTGQFSLDLNVMVPDEAKALKLGKLSRQLEIAKLGEGGEWEANLPTGYDPAVNGKQYLPPKDWSAQNAWHKQQMNRARNFLKKSELLK